MLYGWRKKGDLNKGWCLTGEFTLLCISLMWLWVQGVILLSGSLRLLLWQGIWAGYNNPSDQNKKADQICVSAWSCKRQVFSLKMQRKRSYKKSGPWRGVHSHIAVFFCELQNMIMVLYGSVTKTSWRNSFQSWESTISHGNRRPSDQETAGTYQFHGRKAWSRKEKTQEAERASSLPVLISPNLWVSQGFAHEELSSSTASNKHARMKHRPSPKSLSLRNQPSTS